jgi:hypothetical protein
MALVVLDTSLLIFLENGFSARVHFEVAKHILDIELSERENLRDLIVLKMLLLEDLSSISVDHVAILVNEVASAIDASLQLVEQVALLVGDGFKVAFIVLRYLPDTVGNVESTPVVVEKLGEVAI